MIQAWVAAFLLGFAGSLHCVGMCGPLVLALPTSQLGPRRRVRAAGLYHSGRIMVYTLAGAFFGLFGRDVYLAGYQRQFSIVLGVLVVGLALFDRLRPVTLSPLRRLILRLWSAPGRAKYFVLGLANGLLPCGMVYLAIAGALTRSRVWEASVFMACFGVGTLPLLLALQYTGHRLGLPARGWMRRAMPVITLVVGALLILRGLNLGIPFISPVLAGAPGRAVLCP